MLISWSFAYNYENRVKSRVVAVNVAKPMTYFLGHIDWFPVWFLFLILKPHKQPLTINSGEKAYPKPCISFLPGPLDIQNIITFFPKSKARDVTAIRVAGKSDN